MAERIILLGGAMGSLLQKCSAGSLPKGFPETMNLNQPELVTGIHRSYVEAGSEIIYTNTLGANAKKAKHAGFSVEDVVSAAVANARKACFTHTRVALDIGPIGEMPAPYGDYEEEEMFSVFTEIITAGNNADLIVLETMTDINEVLIAVKAARAISDLHVFATMTFTAFGKTIMGVTPEAAAKALTDAGVFALGMNCSLGPDEVYPIIEKLSSYTTLPLIVKPNAGMPDPKTGEYQIKPQEFADKMKRIADCGVRYMGGCCGTDPNYIKAMKSMVSQL